MQIPLPELQYLCAEALQGLGYSDEESQIITEACT